MVYKPSSLEDVSIPKRGQPAGNGSAEPKARVTTRANVTLMVRRTESLRLKMTGMTLGEIAEAQNISRGTARNDILYCLREMYEERIEKSEQLSTFQLARYERIIKTHWDKAMAGNISATHIILSTLSRIDAILGLAQKAATKDVTPEATRPAEYSQYELARRIAYMLRTGMKAQQAEAQQLPQPTSH